MWRLRNYINTYTVYNWSDFSTQQLATIAKAYYEGCDVAVCINPAYTVKQLKELVIGLRKGLDVNLYSDIKLNAFSMRQVRFGLEQCLDVSLYNDPNLDQFTREIIFEALLKNYPMQHFLSGHYTNKEMIIIIYCYEAGHRLDFLDKQKVDLKCLQDYLINCKINESKATIWNQETVQ